MESKKTVLLPQATIEHLTSIIGEVIRPDNLVVASGGTFLSLTPLFKRVLAYEKDREIWTRLYQNCEKVRDKVTVYNQDFEVGEDLQLLVGVNVPNPEKNTIVFFEPPWVAPGQTLDVSNYLQTGIRVNGILLEEWARILCQGKGFRAVIFSVPPGYKMVLPGQLLDRHGLIYFTADSNLSQQLQSRGLTQFETIKEYTPSETVPSHQEALEELPPPVLVAGPKAVLQTFLTKDFPERMYVREPANPKAIHIGQRKLLLSEIEFLTRILKLEPGPFTLLYIGAAPGQHIPLLSDMFPEVKFILYDPAPFAIKETDKIKIHQKLFTDQELENHRYHPALLLVSDIRSAPRQNYQNAEDVDPEFEDEVRKNLEQQKKWVLELKPMRSLLKFRLPFTAPEEQATTEYFDGVIFFQAYPPAQSAETRLEVSRMKMIPYSHTKYEQQMFYFNTVYRPQSFVHYNRKYGWSYDTIREFYILKKYLAFRGRGDHEIPKYFQLFDSLTNHPSKKISEILARY